MNRESSRPAEAATMPAVSARPGATGGPSPPPYDSPPLPALRGGPGVGWLVPLVALLVLAAIWAWRILSPEDPALTLAAGDAITGAAAPSGSGTADGATVGAEGGPGGPPPAGEREPSPAETGPGTGEVPGDPQTGAGLPADTPAAVVVHVAGAVAKPGVYRLPAGARVMDAIEAAGGPSPQAELHALNLAAPLEDGTRIQVPTREEVASGRFTPPAPGGDRVGPVAPQDGGRLLVDINRAGVDELEQLPGIGPALAQRIVADRQVNGPFRRPEDLARVSGIGEKKLAQLLPYIRAGR
ncbi:MAG: hypothetical protein DIU69_04160 [Bacillota bacterium]|nr:MAG: hypothetical protein DIU69_04160 [Bacillota bacterium]